jgi:putative phosphoesterase
MRVAAIYDIHANLPALKAVLKEISNAAVDVVLVGGDVLPGPMPRASLELLLDLPVRTQFIYGNGEVAVLEQLQGRQPARVPEQHRPIIRWTAEQLDSGHQQILKGWPMTARFDVEGSNVLFCHASPRNENDIFTRATPEERLAPIFGKLDVPLVVCGHTHMQFDRMVGKVRVVNAGSVGMPFGHTGADWLMLGPKVEFRHTNYDLAKAAEAIRRTSYPQAESFANHNVVQAPSEQQMLNVFNRAEIKT